MPTYKMQMVRQSNGQDVTANIQAQTSEQAHEIAADRGFVVATCHRIRDTPATDDLAAALDIEPEPPTTAHATAFRPVHPPEYTALRAVSVAATAAGVLIFTAGLILLITLINQRLSAPPGRYPTPFLTDVMVFALPINAIIGGVLTLGLGQAIAGFRDLVRNSWRTAHATEASAAP